MTENLLFVTKGNGNYMEGFSYVTDLAKVIDSSISVLLNYQKSFFEKLQDKMAALAFAEVGEFDSAQTILNEIPEKNLSQNYEDIMAAVAFADAGEINTALDIYRELPDTVKNDAKKKITSINEKCQKLYINPTFEVAFGDINTNIKYVIEKKPNLCMILLSPSLSKKYNMEATKKLLKNISIPITLISKPAKGKVIHFAA